MSQAMEVDANRIGRPRPRRRVWAHDVEVSATALGTKLEAVRARGTLTGDQLEIYKGVKKLLQAATHAANKVDPIPRALSNWWRGTLIEAAYLNLHAAEATIVPLLDDAEVNAEIPEAVARMSAGLHRDDKRLDLMARLVAAPPAASTAGSTSDGAVAGATAAPAAASTSTNPSAGTAAERDRCSAVKAERRAALQKAIQIGYAASDQQHSRVRSFRNVVIVTAMFVSVFAASFVAVVAANPHTVPFCFQPGDSVELYCPTNSPELNAAVDPAGEGAAVDDDGEIVTAAAVTATAPGPSRWDVIVVALLGLVGGALAAAVSIRNIRGTSTPYSLPAALALLKLPLGALTALGGLIFIGGDFIPGLSSLDSQGQILAYALLFGYGQQVLTRLIDNQADTVLSTVPSKSPVTAPANSLPGTATA